MRLIDISASALLIALFFGFPAPPAQAQATQAQATQAPSADEKIQQLEQKVDQLDQRLRVAERLKEIKAEEDTGKANKANGGGGAAMKK